MHYSQMEFSKNRILDFRTTYKFPKGMWNMKKPK